MPEIDSKAHLQEVTPNRKKMIKIEVAVLMEVVFFCF